MYINNHTGVFGSYYSRVRGLWGYSCCHSLMKNSYCTGAAGKVANDAANGQNIDIHQARYVLIDVRCTYLSDVCTYVCVCVCVRERVNVCVCVCYVGLYTPNMIHEYPSKDHYQVESIVVIICHHFTVRLPFNFQQNFCQLFVHCSYQCI